jgi:hypothetical protein
MRGLSTSHAGAFVLFAVCIAVSNTAGARDWSLPRSAMYKAAQLDAVMLHELEPIFPEVLLEEDAAAVNRGPGPVRFAVAADVMITPNTHGTWEVLDDAGRLWRLRVTSPNATDLNFGFTRFRLPEGATLHLVSEHHDYFQGPYGAADNRDHGELWTPVIPGDRAVIELYVPADPAFEPELVLGRIGRGYRDLFNGTTDLAKQGSCNIDVVCPEGEPWRDEIQSVAVYSVNGIKTCTGSMIMDVPGSFRPFFLTAFHCDVSASNDQTVVTYWNYHSPTCGELGGGTLTQSVSGSTLVSRRWDNDFTLLELEGTPPQEFNVYWAGWDRRDDHTPQGAVSIHHPHADEKAISFNDDPLTITSSCIATGNPDTHWRVDNWEHGTTERGSSGSGLWDPCTRLLVGYLSGGEASCSNTDGFDCYGRFAVAWDGATQGERLRDWLDPNNTGASTVFGSYFNGGADFSCGNAGYGNDHLKGASTFGDGDAADPNFMFAVRFELGDFDYRPGRVAITGFCASNRIGFDGGPWASTVFIYPDKDGLPDDSRVLGRGTISTGDGAGNSVVTLPKPVTLNGDFWLVARGDGKLDSGRLNLEFDTGPNTGHSYQSSTGISGLAVDNDPGGFPCGVNYLLRADLQPVLRFEVCRPGRKAPSHRRTAGREPPSQCGPPWPILWIPERDGGLPP